MSNPTQHTIVLPGQHPDGTPILSVLLKRSYRIVSDGPALPLQQAKSLVPGDRHFGDPMNTTVAHESDHVPFKPATDVVIQAHVHAPGGVTVQQLMVSAIVGTFRKNVMVFGDRTAHYQDRGAPRFSDPAPFTTMELRYERAYGGTDVRSDPTMACAYARNHLGYGFVVRNARESVEGAKLPNIESPDDLLTPDRLCCGHVMHWEAQPKPDGLGWYSKYWQPRAALAGVMPGDRKLERGMRRAFARVVLPHQQADYAKTGLPDMNFAFFNGASPGLARPYLAPGERIAFRNLHPDGDVIGALPAAWPQIHLDIGEGPQEAACDLQTVFVRLDEREMDLVWRAAFRYPGLDWLPRMRRMHVEIGEP